MLENEYPLPSYLASSLGVPSPDRGEGWVETPEPELGGEVEGEVDGKDKEKDEDGDAMEDDERGEGGEGEGDKKPTPTPVYAIDCEMVSPPLLCALKREL